jgi:endonuclease-3 related protein
MPISSALVACPSRSMNKSARRRAIPRDSRPPLDEYYNCLDAALGPQHWWPGDTPFEVIVGAILTQNTAWTNVEQAIDNLKRENLMSPEALENIPLRRLARLVRPSGYFRQKAKKLKEFVGFLQRDFDGSLERMFQTPTAELREKLLRVFGIGPETADSILLYAGGHAVFVIDAYTKRILKRHGWVNENAKYEEIRELFETHLDRDTECFTQYHALLVNVGKNWCQARVARCERCPLGGFHEAGR